MNPYLLAGALGGLVAFVLAIPAIILEIIHRGKEQPNMPFVVDVKTMFGRKLNRYEVFAAAILLHVVLGFLFGVIYVLFVERGWLVVTHAPFTFLSLLVYAVGAFVVVGLAIFPALGMGLFGRKEGRRVWMEILVGMLFNGVGVWLLVRWFWPWFFSGS